jgi:hypothetical protein
MPKVDQVFQYYDNRKDQQDNTLANKQQTNNVIGQFKSKVGTFLGEKSAQANIMARNLEIYNPKPDTPKNISDELVKSGLRDYTNSDNPDNLREAKSKLEQANQTGQPGYYDHESITRAIQSINDQLLQYKLRDAKVAM